MRFVERHCVVPEGPLVGKPLRLAGFQEDFYRSVYDNPAGTRMGLLSTARKNAKTATIATMAMVHLVGPEARLNSRIGSGARSRRQAAEVYNYASKMVLLSQSLRKLVRPVPSAKRLVGLPMNVEYEALSAEGKTAHGNSLVVAILDEVGQVRGEKDDFVDAIVTSQGAYDDPLLLAISTQAPTDADLFSIWIDDAERSRDPRTVCHVYQAPPDAGVRDESAWAAANPALGLFRSRQELADAAIKADRLPSEETAFRLLYLNQRVVQHAPLFSARVWADNAGPPDEDAFYEGPVWGGLDLSRTTDLSALVLVARKDGLLHVKPYFWTPADTMLERAKRDRVPYVEWHRAGHLMAPPGNAIDFAFVARDIARITKGMRVERINFDRHLIGALEAELQRQDVRLPLEPFGQGFVSMMPAINAAEIEFLEKRVRHGGHPVLTNHAANCVPKMDEAGNRKLDKVRSSGRIDGIVALVMAIGAAASSEGTAQSVYEQRGALII